MNHNRDGTQRYRTVLKTFCDEASHADKTDDNQPDICTTKVIICILPLYCPKVLQYQ